MVDKNVVTCRAQRYCFIVVIAATEPTTILKCPLQVIGTSDLRGECGEFPQQLGVGGSSEWRPIVSFGPTYRAGFEISLRSVALMIYVHKTRNCAVSAVFAPAFINSSQKKKNNLQIDEAKYKTI